MHTLFALEDRKLLRITNVDGLICLRAEIFDGGIRASDLEQRLRAWQEQSAKLKTGEITKEDYDRWRYHYPAFDDTIHPCSGSTRRTHSFQTWSKTKE